MSVSVFDSGIFAVSLPQPYDKLGEASSEPLVESFKDQYEAAVEADRWAYIAEAGNWSWTSRPPWRRPMTDNWNTTPLPPVQVGKSIRISGPSEAEALVAALKANQEV